MEEIIVNNQLSRWRLGTFCSSEIKFFDKFSKLLHEMVIIMACLKHFLILYLFACVLGIVNGQYDFVYFFFHSLEFPFRCKKIYVLRKNVNKAE